MSVPEPEMTTEQQINETEARWGEALKTAPAATIRGYYHSIVKMGKGVWLWGIMGMAYRLGVSPADILVHLEDRYVVQQIAEARGISLEDTDVITAEEEESYRQTYNAVYSDFIAKGITDSIPAVSHMNLEA